MSEDSFLLNGGIVDNIEWQRGCFTTLLAIDLKAVF